MKNKIIHIKFADIIFRCPHCKKKYIDKDEKYYYRIDKAKSQIARIKCIKCGNNFQLTYDITSKLVTW